MPLPTQLRGTTDPARIGCARTMPEPDQKPAVPNGVTGTTAEDAEVRATIEQTREVLESSGAELERAKRLLRETEKLVDVPRSPAADDADGKPGTPPAP